MSKPDVETVDFGATAEEVGGQLTENSGEATHRAGYMEAPAEVEGAAREATEGAAKPTVGPITEV